MDLDRHNIGLGQRPALIVVDMITGFTDPACELGCECPSVVEANASIIKEMRRQAAPIFFTTVIYREKEQASIFRKRVPALNLLTPDSKWVQVDPKLKPNDDEPIVEKQWASAFFKTNLDSQLRQKEVDSIIVTGLTTSGCVRATVIDSLQNNYPTVVPREAVGDRNQNAHEANLHDIHAKYADVMLTRELILQLQNAK